MAYETDPRRFWASKRLTRRSALGLLSSAAGAAFLAACGGSSKSSQSSSGSPAASSQPKSGGTLRTGLASELATIDGAAGGTQYAASSHQVYDPILGIDDKLQPQPGLVESWELTPDYRQIKLNLRKDVKFHTGRELTSEDIEYNILRVRQPAVGSQLAAQSAGWTTIEKPDKYTVIMKADQPRTGVFEMLSRFNIVDKETVEGPNAKTKAVGTGAFEWTEYIPGDHITLTKNKNYWQSGKPYLDKIIISLERDEQAMAVRLESNALDLANAPQFIDAARLQKSKDYQVVNFVGAIYFYMSAQTTKPPTNDKVVRQALNYAIDRKRFTDTIIYGFAEPSALPWSPQGAQYEEAKAKSYAFNLDKARSLLQSAGVNALEIDLNYSDAVAGGAQYKAFAQMYQADLAKIGVKANLKNLNATDLAAGTRNAAYSGVLVVGSGFANTAVMAFESGRGINATQNAAGFVNDRYKELVNSVSIEPDPAKRKPIYSQINDLILDESFTMALSQFPTIMVARSNVKGLRVSQAEKPLLAEVWLA